MPKPSRLSRTMKPQVAAGGIAPWRGICMRTMVSVANGSGVSISAPLALMLRSTPGPQRPQPLSHTGRSMVILLPQRCSMAISTVRAMEWRLSSSGMPHHTEQCVVVRGICADNSARCSAMLAAVECTFGRLS